MLKPVAVTIGFSCRAIAESLMQTRRPVAVIDCCGDMDTMLWSDWVETVESLQDVQGIMTILAKWFLEFGPLPLVLGGGTENVPELIEAIKERWPEVLPETDWKMTRDWKKWNDWAVEAGFHFPKTVKLKSITDVQAAEFGEQPILFKQQAQAGGLGVLLYENLETLKSELFNDQSSSDQHEKSVVQQALPGRVLGVHFFTSDTKSQVLGVVEGIPTEQHPWGDFVYLGSRGPVHLRAVEALLLERFADIVSRDSGVRGIWNADFIEAPNGWNLIEINPRWSAGLEVLDLCSPPVVVSQESDLNKQKDAPKFSMKRIVYASSDFQITKDQVQTLVDSSHFGAGALQIELPAEEEGDSIRTSVRIADISVPDTKFERGMPVCTLLVTSDSRGGASLALKAGLDWVKILFHNQCL